MYSTNASLRLMKGSGELPVKAKAILAWCHICSAEFQHGVRFYMYLRHALR
jgi:hypothetical protein